MATAEKAAKSVFEFWADAQKDLVSTWKESTENMKDSFLKNETIENSKDYFQKWYDKQVELFNSANNAKTDANPMNWLNNWYNEQMNITKDWHNNYNNWMNTKGFNWNNPTDAMTGAKEKMDTMMNFYQNWNKQATDMYKSWAGKMENPFQKDNFSNMFNSSDVYMKNFEFWMPIYKAFQNNNLDMDMFKNMFNMDQFKGLMDKMFSFAPQGMKETMDTWNKNIKDMFGNTNNQMWNMGQNFANPFNNFADQGNDFFNNITGNYNNFMSKFNEMNSPFIKMMTPGADKNNLMDFQAISDQMMAYNTKSSQMQYLVYVNGLKTVQSFAEFLKNKADKNETYDSFTTFYTDWLNHMDGSFVELFRSKEYSKVQADFSSASHKLKSMMEAEMEKTLAFVPVATRTEMTELYATVTEMNKRIKSLEAELASAKKAANNAPKAAAKTTAPKANGAAPKATTAKTTTKTTAAKK